MTARARRPLWTCPTCGRRFANRNQTHTCAPPTTLDEHFAGKPAHVRAIFDRLVEATEPNGPFEVIPEMTRIAFFVRMSFAAFVARHERLDGHVILARRLEHPRFTKVITYSPRNHEHDFRLTTVDEVDDDVTALAGRGVRRRKAGALGLMRVGIHLPQYGRAASPDAIAPAPDARRSSGSPTCG